jgi:ribosomal-protein-serine acetyltransferase
MVFPINIQTIMVVRIRPLEQSDAVEYAAAARESTATVGKWMDWCTADYSIDMANEWISTCQANFASGSTTAFEFAIVNDNNDFLGGGGVNQINKAHNFANIGYWIRETRQGRGVATAAVRLLVDFAFGTLQLTRVEFAIRPENWPSRRVAEKIGAKFESIAQNRLICHGQPWDAAIYSMVPKEE